MASSAPALSVPAPAPPPTPPPGAWLSPRNDPYPAGAPIIDSIPAAARETSPWTYSEDEIASLWTQIYNFFILVGYLNKGDVVFPPADTGRHVLDRARLQQHFNMSDRVVSLLERLPYPKSGPDGNPMQGEWDFFPECTPFDYLNFSVNEKDIRDPHPALTYRRNGPLPDYLLPDDVALVAPIQSDGLTWILDTRTNGIRTISNIAEIPQRPEWYEPERPDAEHYRNWPSFPATFVLKHYLQDLYELELLPMDRGWGITKVTGDLTAVVVAHTMQTTYGWPGSFRQQDWLRDRERIYKAADGIKDSVAEGGGPGETRETELRYIQLWRENPTLMPLLELD